MFLRFPVDLTRPPAALECSSQFPVLSENRFELCRIATLRANAAAANGSKLGFEILAASPGSEFRSLSTEHRELRTGNCS
jgi:hypothetical protein